MHQYLKIGTCGLSFADACALAFNRPGKKQLEFASEARQQVQHSRNILLQYIECGSPIYGVTTGFGDSCHRLVAQDSIEALQENLIAYLMHGTGKNLPPAATRAMFLARIQSLARGYSGVSEQLIDRMLLFFKADVLPIVPEEGSLGASGDLIPLAYLANMLRGCGSVTMNGQETTCELAMRPLGLSPYNLQAKEGLALVNGTSAMAGYALVNTNHFEFILDLSIIATAWACLILEGKNEAFSPFVNATAKSFSGQARAAQMISHLLDGEGYRSAASTDTPRAGPTTQGFVQDRYSLRCAPQVLGPLIDTCTLSKTWVEQEFNSTSDNPLVDRRQERLLNGGNFYGGYMAHAMDYTKICLSHIADLLDRQLLLIIDEKSNRGLPPNLANWPGIPEHERHLHHGLKGLHQAVNAVSAEIISQSMPVSVFSRSSESHNQDKVSLGLSAAASCAQSIDKMFSLQALLWPCLAQAIDLKQIKFKGKESQNMYEFIRSKIQFYQRDQSKHGQVNDLKQALIAWSNSAGRILGPISG